VDEARLFWMTLSKSNEPLTLINDYHVWRSVVLAESEWAHFTTKKKTTGCSSFAVALDARVVGATPFPHIYQIRFV
jgi:hypothetical protein